MDVKWSFGDWDATYGIQCIHATEESCGYPAAFGFDNAAFQATVVWTDHLRLNIFLH